MASDQERQADISDAHHESFGTGVAWADQTPDTGDGALDLGAVRERQHATTGPHAWIGSEAHWDAIIASLADVPDLVDEVVALRLTLTEAEAERDTLTAQLAEAEKVGEAAREFVEFWRGRAELEAVAGWRLWSLLAALTPTRAETTDG